MTKKRAKREAVKFSGDGTSPEPAEYVEKLDALNARGALAPDEYGCGGSVERLEARMAGLLGKETAVFMPTGTLANLLAVRVLSGARSRVVVPAESHISNDSGDGATLLGGLTLLPLGRGRPCYTVVELGAEIKRAKSGKIPSEIGVAVVEMPVRRLNNRVPPWDEVRSIVRLCRQRGIATHLDGARLFSAAVVSGRGVRRYAALFDTVYVSLYKHFGAPSGAVLAGSRRLLQGLRDERRRFGGSPFQAYFSAALALDGLDGFESRYRRALASARRFFVLLRGVRGASVESFRDGTNVHFLRLSKARPAAFARRLGGDGVVLGPYDPSIGGFRLCVNETILRRSPQELADIFRRALRV